MYQISNFLFGIKQYTLQFLVVKVTHNVFAKDDAILISVAVSEVKDFAILSTIVVYPLWISKNYIKWDNLSRFYLA